MTDLTQFTDLAQFTDSNFVIVYAESKPTEVTDQFTTQSAIEYWEEDLHVATLHYSREEGKYVLQCHVYNNVIATVLPEDICKSMLQNLEYAHEHVKASLDFVGCNFTCLVVRNHRGRDCEIVEGYFLYVSDDMDFENLAFCQVENFSLDKVVPIYGESTTLTAPSGTRYSYLTEVLDNFGEVQALITPGDVLRLHEGYFLLARKSPGKK